MNVILALIRHLQFSASNQSFILCNGIKAIECHTLRQANGMEQIKLVGIFWGQSERGCQSVLRHAYTDTAITAYATV